ncbi:MAG: DUF3343 domain-containing protein [Actinobacteria bacterium]|nr:DUF3343 domain-containing protein [Actinomycetota bacterium]
MKTQGSSRPASVLLSRCWVNRNGPKTRGVRIPKEKQIIDCYVLFESHTHGWRLFGLLREEGIAARISPTPRAARSSCGVSLLIECSDRERVERVAAAAEAEYAEIVELPSQINPNRNRYC